MNSPFSFSKYAGVVGTAMWTLGWILVAAFAAQYGASQLDTLIAIIGVIVGGMITIRSYPRTQSVDKTTSSPPESWSKRISGWVAAIVWCFAAVVWNLAIFGSLARSATHGQSLTFVILIPFSLIGLLLLIVLFTSISAVLDWLFRLDDATAGLATTGPVEEAAPASSPTAGQITSPTSKSVQPALESSFKKFPILTTLALLFFVNWFVFFGISMYLGGDATGVLPSHNGFVVTSHGHQTAVSEQQWVFSLFYSAASLLVTPLIWLLYAARVHGSKFRTAKWPMKLFICVFLTVWVLGWYSSIGSSFYHSLQDWQNLKHSTAPAQPSRQPPLTTTNVNQ